MSAADAGQVEMNSPARMSPPRWSACTVIGVFFLVTIAPTLAWNDFSSGSENINVATALEMVRDGGGLRFVPTLQAKPRTSKPPLTAWITAAVIPDSLVRGMSDPDAAVRAAAQRALAWHVRCTALLAGCGIIIATYLLAELLADASLALVAALVCGSTLMFLRQARLSTTDIQLALWVAVGNVLFARALLRGTTWANCVAAGFVLALALMTKGPVALVQTLVPAWVWLAWHRSARRDEVSRPRLRVMPAISGLALMLIAGSAWYVYVLTRGQFGSTLGGWWREVTREGASSLRASDWFNYLAIFPMLFPWCAFLIVGLVLAWRGLRAKRREPLLLALFLFVVPILIMSLFRDRKERYLTPMVAPAAIVIAWGVREHLRSWATWSRADTITTSIHWGLLGVAAVGLPLAGAMGIRGLTTVDGQPWYSMSFGIAAAVALAGLTIAASVCHLRWKGSLVAGTVLVMLLLQGIAAHGYRHSPQAVSRMKQFADAIWDAAPDADVVNAYRNRVITPSDLSIYLNRAIPIQLGVPVPQGRPVVLLLYQRKDDPAPLRPDGFRRIAEVTEEDGSSWYAVVRR